MGLFFTEGEFSFAKMVLPKKIAAELNTDF
jgi:hypothetical protein